MERWHLVLVRSLIGCAAIGTGCDGGRGPQRTVTVTRDAGFDSGTAAAEGKARDNAAPERVAQQWAGLRACAKEWNRSASDAQLRELALAALIDPVRRDRKSTAWVDRWSFAEGDVALIGPGERGSLRRARRGDCLVATGLDVGKVYIRLGGRWRQISGDAPTELAYPAVMMARAGGDAWIRRDGTVAPIVGTQD